MPNRILKESICSSDTIDSLSYLEEVFFYRLIVNCDDYGRFDARTAILKSRLFPLKDIREKDIEEVLSRMQLVGIVRVYECDGRPYLQLANWERHQTIRNKKSKYPSENEALENNCNQLKSIEIKCTRNPIQSESESNPNPISCVRRFEEFFYHYPNTPHGKPRPATEYAYIDLLKVGVTEEELIQAVKNYAEYCKSLDSEQYIRRPDNFLDMQNGLFKEYLPGKYKPIKVKNKNSFNQFPQNDINFDAFEKEILSN